MKCLVLVANKLGSVPLIECGSVLLSPNDKIIVKEEIAKKMLSTYGRRLLEVGTIDKEKLFHGHFQLGSEKGKDFYKKPVKTVSRKPKKVRAMTDDRAIKNEDEIAKEK